MSLSSLLFAQERFDCPAQSEARRLERLRDCSAYERLCVGGGEEEVADKDKGEVCW